MCIEYDLLPKQKRRKKNLNVEIDLFPVASELYDCLDSIGIIERSKDVPQLGLIKVNINLKKSRFDYIMLQLYMHQVIKKNIKRCLQYTYNSRIGRQEFLPECEFFEESFTIADILQCLTIANNVGHFYNTFTASRALIMLASKYESFKNAFIDASSSERFKDACHSIIDARDYMRMHLLNTLIILDRCDQTKRATILTKEIVYAYLKEGKLSVKSKLHYVFELFRIVRNNAYVAYDLQIANTPFTIDLWNEEAITAFFKEQLSIFNNGKYSRELVEAIQKLLDSTVYNENSNAICYHQIAKRIYKITIDDFYKSGKDYYSDYFFNKESCFNREYSQRRDYCKDGILKITFSEKDRGHATSLINSFEHTNGLRLGYYNRSSGATTILVSIIKNSKKKGWFAFRILKRIIRTLSQIDTEPSDDRYILAVKFFLKYLFDGKNTIIKPTVSEKKCVFCTRGKSKRVSELSKILNHSSGSEDDNHEVQVMIDFLKTENKNDTCITIAGSTLVYNEDGSELCQFDGIVIFPYRTSMQVVFIEAKNTLHKPSNGKKCLREKFKRLGWKCNVDDIKQIGHDAIYAMTV